MNDCCKIKTWALGFGLGFAWALAVLFVGWMAWLFEWGNSFVAIMASIYIGYAPTLIGGIVGGIWAFVIGFIGGVIIAWVNNWYCTTCCKS